LGITEDDIRDLLRKLEGVPDRSIRASSTGTRRTPRLPHYIIIAHRWNGSNKNSPDLLAVIRKTPPKDG
jgi:hypothetical protein